MYLYTSKDGCDENIYALGNQGNEIGNADVRIVYLRFAESEISLYVISPCDTAKRNFEFTF